MKKEKPVRGEYGYLKAAKKKAAIHTVLMVVIGLAIFVLGLLLNKMEAANIFTVFAFLMVLPAAKSFVTVVVLFPFQPMDKETMERLTSYARGQDVVFYDVVFTSSERIMHLDCIYVTGHQLIAYTGRRKDNVKAISEYLKKELSARGTDFAFYLATEEKQIIDRMKLRGEENDTNQKVKDEVVEMLRVFTV